MGNAANQKAANKWLSVPIIATVTRLLCRELTLQNEQIFTNIVCHGDSAIRPADQLGKIIFAFSLYINNAANRKRFAALLLFTNCLS